MLERALRLSSLLALLLVALNHAAHHAFATPLATDRIAEWIMARTPNSWAVPLLTTLGEWAKPLAATGGLAAIGFSCFLLTLAALRLARNSQPAPPSPARRSFLAAAIPAVMTAGTAAVAIESWARNRAYAAKAVDPVDLWPHQPPAERETFAPGLVRPSVTSVEAFYGMSKNTVDPVIDPRSWQLRITLDGRPLRSFSYTQLLNLPRLRRYTTMRCVSNTLTSNLMGTAEWSGIFLRQLIDPATVPSAVVEVAFIGVDGHDDSIPAAYAFSEELLLALGMNGKTLDRVHGFPFRLIAPRYYGFKSVKWMAEIRLCTTPYFGTWPKLGYTKEPAVHTMSYVDRIRRENGTALIGGVAFAGMRGIERVELRAGSGPWTPAQLEAPLSPYTWTRWKARLETGGAKLIEVRALARDGRWQAVEETPLFPDGVAGPTIKKLT
jgi:DMSO/TMAO reductase YedYZ molybdopterin-dependent catalytic subunit